MKKLSYLIILALILGLALTGCSLLSNISQVPTSEQSGITYLTKGPDSLVGLWHLDEKMGEITIVDSSGNGNDGSVSGATTGVSGKFDNAVSFDGDGDYVQLPASNTILNTNTFTIEAWFKTSVNHPVYGSLGGIGEGRIVNLARDTAGFTAVALYVEQDNIAICYHTGTAFKHLSYAVDYHDDTWHHIAVTRDSTTYRLYYDGVEVASQSDAFVGFGTSAAYLGTFYPITTIDPIKRFFNGTIDEVRIWSTATPSFNLNVEEPKLDFNPVGTDHTVTATVTIGETEPAPGVLVDFNVSGVNSPPPSSVLTDINGQAQFTYTGSNAGEDIIEAAINEEPYMLVSEKVKKYWLENFVTGGGNKKDGKKVAWTFAGTVGNLEGGSVGQFQIVDHTNKVAYHCNNDFSYLVFTGDKAEFIGTFTNNINAIDEDDLTIIIEDLGEPGAGTDKISVTGSITLSTTLIDGGNFQVHEL